MSGEKRPFRTEASYISEKNSRSEIAPFLESRKIKVLDDHRRVVGRGESQLVEAVLPDGSHVKMRVRLCWRRDGRNATENSFSAFQLSASTIEGDWQATLQHLVERDAKDAVTHTLAIQMQDGVVVYAAMIPSNEIPAIWLRQREVSDDLISRRALGRTRKNHAANGDSPTMWLQDTRNEAAHEVSDVLWGWPGVIDLVGVPVESLSAIITPDDSWDDMPLADSSGLGSDGAQRHVITRSSVKRDPKVRAAVIVRSSGKCERNECGASRDFAGFLDVHHILGVEKSDRVYNCVALCPNCHRDAHFAPDADAINQELLRYAQTV